MYVINCVEIKYIRGERVPSSEHVEFENYNDLINATANMDYLNSIFGKHYRFYITKKNTFPIIDRTDRFIDTNVSRRAKNS